MIKVLFAVLMITSTALAQTAAPDAAELTKLLNDFLAGASRNDPAAHERFWADDLIYTRSAGRRTTKAEIMHDLRSAPAPKPDDPKTIYTAEDIRIQQYGNTAIVAFRLVATTEVNGAKQVQNLLNSGTFLKRNGKWQVVNWQSTRMPRTEEENRKDVAATVADFRNALAHNDAKKLIALTDPAFTWITPARQTTREQLAKLNAASLENANETISLYSETAVVRGEGRYTMTLVNQNGAWKIVALQTIN
jgi:ketosteroid isomerase-like protein